MGTFFMGGGSKGAAGAQRAGGFGLDPVGSSVPRDPRNERDTRPLFLLCERRCRRLSGRLPRMLERGVLRPPGDRLDTTATRAVLPPLAEDRCSQLLRELGLQARSFRFEVAPNPCVGAAVLSGDR